MITEKSTVQHSDGRLSNSGFQHRHHQRYGRHQALPMHSSRYIKAQMRNRMELMRLDERRETLDRQQRQATASIDRHKRKLAEEMNDVTRTTSDLTGGVHRRATTAAAGTTSTRRRVMSYDEDDVTPTTLSELRLDDRSVQRCRRQPASATDTTTTHSETAVASPLAQTTTGTSTRPRPAFGATSTRRRVMSYDEDDVTPTTLSELRLDDRSVQRRRRQPASAAHTTTTLTETAVASPLAQTTGTSTRLRRAFPDAHGRPITAAAGASRSAAGRSSEASRDAGVKRDPAFTKPGLSRANSSPKDRPRSSGTLRLRTAATGLAAADTGNPPELDDTSTGGGAGAAGQGRGTSSSRWKVDLRREAPPALFGHRRSHSFHVAVMSPAADRRRRLVALPTRQVAYLTSRPVHSSNGATSSKADAPRHTGVNAPPY